MSDQFNPKLHVFHRVTAGPGHANELPKGPDGRRVARVWTVMDADLLREIGPVHNRSAFLEDFIHDWNLDGNGRMRFYSRVVDTDQEVEILLDYESTMEARQRRNSGARFDPQTGKAIPKGPA